MHWRNWIFLGVAASVAVVAIEGARMRVRGATHTLRRPQLNLDDRKPDWYQPQDTRPVNRKPVEPIGPG